MKGKFTIYAKKDEKPEIEFELDENEVYGLTLMLLKMRSEK